MMKEALNYTKQYTVVVTAISSAGQTSNTAYFSIPNMEDQKKWIDGIIIASCICAAILLGAVVYWLVHRGRQSYQTIGTVPT